MTRKRQAGPTAQVLARLRAHKVAVARMAVGALSDVREYVPSGVNVVDYHLLGGGGLHVGRLCELSGDEGTGKTSLAFAFMAGAQRGGGAVMLAEAERALQVERATVFGVQLDDVVLAQPNTLEEALTGAAEFMAACEAGKLGPNLWVYDSLAAGVPEAEADKPIGDVAMGAVARVMSATLRRLLPLAVRSRTALLVVNQNRMKIGRMFGNPVTTTGGNAIKFYASERLQLMGGAAVKGASGEPVGKDITAICTKNKLQRPHGKARVRLSYAHGWVEPWSTLTHAKDRALVPPKAQGAGAYAEACKVLGWPVQAGPPSEDGEAEDLLLVETE